MKQIPSYNPQTSTSTGTGLHVQWQNGPMVEGNENGATVELLIRACVQRLEGLDSFVPSDYNRTAIQHLNDAIVALENRTKDRARRGVMGTQYP